MSERRNWERDELILTINLYYKTPFGRLHARNPDVIELAKIIGRTPGAVAFKLVNFASFDPTLKARGIKGASNASKLDRIIWDEFNANLEDSIFDSEFRYEQSKQPELTLNDIRQKFGEDKETTAKQRVNQSFFRSTLLASYNSTCCITGIQKSSLLIASHIKPWAEDKENRLNPQNGLLLNSLHDRAFENGFITITEDFKILVCKEILDSDPSSSEYKYIAQYHSKEIIQPTKFLPDKQFLDYHYEERFRK